ncbi:ABC transporter ATP-binding protein [Rhodococcus sp. HNM0569]|uniref:ABC transporter ATP-binding protein n=1 Tax=Rhodococcus sp. HNM0569 TaxID=2716340 RepID=UPI00146AE1E8|nr:ABC transporter ATP-binding protein [Rhodococcus sp. HNM0569]NLU82517.1 ABC transporter ATP-binding protein [Rhodococcus sp. HNM0569]
MPDTTVHDLAGSLPNPKFLHLEQISKGYHHKNGWNQIVGDIDIAIEEGQFVSLLGPSGCGKSTVLSMIAGLTEPDEGNIWLDRHPITGPGHDRGVVFQQHVLLPWMTARENVLFGLDSARRNLPRAQREELADHYLETVKLGHAKDRRPGELSGGMQQRVGIARAFALQPKVLLLDEPFGALDALTRVDLQNELLRLWESERRTVVMVTHDVDEAIVLSDRILVLSHGPAATVTQDIAVPFARPRSQDELNKDPRFYDLRAALLASLTAPTTDAA